MGNRLEGIQRSVVRNEPVTAALLDRLACDPLLTQLEVTIHPLVQLPAVLDR